MNLSFKEKGLKNKNSLVCKRQDDSDCIIKSNKNLKLRNSLFSQDHIKSKNTGEKSKFTGKVFCHSKKS